MHSLNLRVPDLKVPTLPSADHTMAAVNGTSHLPLLSSLEQFQWQTDATPLANVSTIVITLSCESPRVCCPVAYEWWYTAALTS